MTQLQPESRPEPTSPAWKRALPRVLAAIFAGVLTVLACPDYDIWWLGFIAWIPWFWAIDGMPLRRAFLLGWVTGIVTVFWGFFWLTELLVRFAGFSTLAASPVAMLFALYHGLLWALPVPLGLYIARRSPSGTGAPIWLVMPLAWVVVEALLPNIFPVYMGHVFCWQPLWIQTAEIGGPTTVSFIVVAINAGLYCVGRAAVTQRRLDKGAAIFTAALLVGTPTYGAIRMAQVDEAIAAAPKLKIGVVQGNMSIREVGTRQLRPEILRKQQEMSAELEAAGAQVVLWGETAYPNSSVFGRQDAAEPPPGDRWRLHEGFSVPAIIGAVTRSRSDPYPYNTALLVTEDGRVTHTYDKVFRLIFGEYIPVIDPEWYLAKIPQASYIAKGRGPEVFELQTDSGTARLGPFICYEDLIPRYVRELAREGVHAFVNLTNDAWFGKTHEPAQHLGLAVMRTVEHRRAMVRAVNTGISTYIDPAGRVLVRTELTDPDTEGPQPADGFIAEVPLMDVESRTLYGRTGELFDILCGLGLVALGWLRRKRG